MPIYEYHCSKCKKNFEVLVFGDKEVTCPTCKKKKVKKIMSTFSHSSGHKYRSSAGSGCGSCTSTNCDSCR